MRATHPNQITDLLLVALNEGNSNAVMALYEDSAVLADAIDTPAVGRTAIRERIGKFLKLDPSFEVHDAEVAHAGDLALVHSIWTIRWTNDKGKASTSNVDVNLVARRQENGHWLIVIDRPIETP